MAINHLGRSSTPRVGIKSACYSIGRVGFAEGSSVGSNPTMHVYFFFSWNLQICNRYCLTNRTKLSTTKPMPNYGPYVIIFGVGAMIAYEIIKDALSQTHTLFHALETTCNLFRIILGGAALSFVYSQLE
jgi:hypothetical protein